MFRTSFKIISSQLLINYYSELNFFFNPEIKFTNAINNYCGDKLIISIDWINNNSVINSIFFNHIGCILSRATINVLCFHIQFANKEYIFKLLNSFYDMFLNKELNKSLPEDLQAFFYLSNNPSRINCIFFVIEHFLNELNN